MSKRNKDRCLHDDNKAQSRGVCGGCLRYGHDLIRAGIKTDDELVADGYFLKGKPVGRPRKETGLAKKIAKAKAKR